MIYFFFFFFICARYKFMAEMTIETLDVRVLL